MTTQAKHSISSTPTNHTLKEYKKNKEHIKKLIANLEQRYPVLYKQTKVRAAVHGFHLINEGIVYHPDYKEPIDPCETYIVDQIRHEPINHEDNLKHVFMDRGVKGLLAHVQALPIYAEAQRRRYPELYKNLSQTNS